MTSSSFSKLTDYSAVKMSLDCVVKMLYLIGPDGLVNQGYSYFDILVGIDDNIISQLKKSMQITSGFVANRILIS